MLFRHLKPEYSEKEIECPSCGEKTISGLMLMGGNEAVCSNCKNILLSLHYRKQRCATILFIVSCALPLVKIYLLPVPFLAFYFASKLDLKASDSVVLKKSIEN